MLNQHHREKLIHAAIFFIQNTQSCQKTKLLKLLYLLDFEHYRQVGRTVTGLKYQAWREGPVPPQVFEEIEDPEEGWSQHIEAICNPIGFNNSSPTWDLKAKAEFDASLFSRRELAILKEVASKYKTHSAKSLVHLCHDTPPWNIPWKRVWEEEGRQWSEIDLGLFLGKEDTIAREAAADHEEMVRNYS